MSVKDNSTIPRVVVHKSIIKEVVRCDSSESEDCISIDGHDDPISPPILSNISTQTSTTFSPTDNVVTENYSNRFDTLTGDTNPRIFLYGSHSPCPPRENLHVNPRQSRSPSPYLYRKINEQEPRTIASRRSNSLEYLSLPRLGETLTDDSGTGDIETSCTPVSPFNPRLQIVPVVGLPHSTVALMANRYDFDQTKIDEYRQKKSKVQTLPPRSPKPPKRDRTNSFLKSKSSNFITSVIHALKPPTPQQYSIQPITRHHTSHDITNDSD